MLGQGHMQGHMLSLHCNQAGAPAGADALAPVLFFGRSWPGILLGGSVRRPLVLGDSVHYLSLPSDTSPCHPLHPTTALSFSWMYGMAYGESMNVRPRNETAPWLTRRVKRCVRIFHSSKCSSTALMVALLPLKRIGVLFGNTGVFGSMGVAEMSSVDIVTSEELEGGPVESASALPRPRGVSVGSQRGAERAAQSDFRVTVTSWITRQRRPRDSGHQRWTTRVQRSTRHTKAHGGAPSLTFDAAFRMFRLLRDTETRLPGGARRGGS